MTPSRRSRRSRSGRSRSRRRAAAYVRLNIALLTRLEGDPAGADVLLAAALAQLRAAGDDAGIAQALAAIGRLATLEGEVERADRALRESLALRRRLGDVRSIGLTLALLAELASDAGQARTLLRRAHAMFREVGDRPAMLWMLLALARLELAAGGHRAVRDHLERALAICEAVGARAMRGVDARVPGAGGAPGRPRRPCPRAALGGAARVRRLGGGLGSGALRRARPRADPSLSGCKGAFLRSAPMTVLHPPDVALLRAALAGEVITPGDPEYDTARRVWNGAIDRHPAIIARVEGVADVVEAIRFARGEGLQIAVRGGGHNVAGHGTCDGGIVIDLSRMRAVRVDPAARTACVQGGALWSDVDYTTQAFGLGVPGGMVSTTGVAGLTLGGGIGWLSRKHGLTSDNLLAATLVTADGAVLTASPSEHAELFWALRGGGGNFGVVTSLQFRLHPVGDIVGGVILQPLEQAGAVLRGYREVMAEAPDALGTVLSCMTVPPVGDFPAELHGRKVLAIGVCFAGPEGEAQRAIAPLRRLGRPLLERIAVMPYAVRQRLQDATAPAGLCNHWKSDYLTGLDDDVIDAIVGHARTTTSPLSQIHLYGLGGAAARIPEDTTAYAHRAAPFLVSAVALWADPAEEPAPHVMWARSFAATVRPSAAGAYVNFLGDDGADRVRDAYGAEKHRRLAAVKAAYDPENLFRLNHNIEPAS